jgi:ubiquinone/menaquinone biosynthesis C-methylase UbiE
MRATLRPRFPQLFALTLSATAVLAATTGLGQAPPPSPASKVDPAINKPFVNPVAKDYVAKFETESREVYARRDAIVNALGLKPGMAVADIGAGTGLFTRLIAAKVGPEGKVFAAEIAEPFLRHIKAQSQKLGQPQVQVVLVTQTSSGLAANAIDLAFLCDTYHHLENPSAVLRSIRRALKPGGILVVVDFDRVPGKSTEFTLKHVRAGKDVFIAEIKAAGFIAIDTPDAPMLKENFFQKFRRVDDPPPKKPGPVGG